MVDDNRLKTIKNVLKNIPDAEARAKRLKGYLLQGIINYDDLNNFDLNDVVNAGDIFRRKTTFSKDREYEEVIATEEYTLEGSSSKVLTVSTNEFGDVMGYMERGTKGTISSVENNNDGSNRTVKSGPMMHHTIGRVGKYRTEIETKDVENGISNITNSYEYELPERTVEINDVIVSKNGERACKRMVNGVLSFMVHMNDNEITLVQYTKEGEELASYTYDATTGLPKDYDSNLGRCRTYPGIERFNFDDKGYIFEDVISHPSLQRRLLTPEEYKTISEMEQVEFTPSRRLDKLKNRLGIEAQIGDRGNDVNKDKTSFEI